MPIHRFTKRVIVVLLAYAAALLLSACAAGDSDQSLTGPKSYRNDQGLNLEEAAAALGRNLKLQLGQSIQLEKLSKNEALPPAQTPTEQGGQPEILVIDPFVSVDNGHQFKVNDRITTILAQELGTEYKVHTLTKESLAKSRFIIAGTYSQPTVAGNDSPVDCELTIVIFELPSGTIKAKGQIRILNFPFEPQSFYDDSPFSLRDKSVESVTTLTTREIGVSADSDYLHFLQTKALIQNGISLYEHQQFADAMASFSKAIALPDGKTLTSVAGLYLTSEKLQKKDAADKAFADLLSIAIEENRQLDIKLLFGANSPVFIPSPELTKKYAWWLKHIALHMKTSNLCLNILGHSSRSGTDGHNDQLSLSRAKTVQRILAVTYPGIIKKSRVEGKGSQGNIIGSGADSSGDIVDRRVDFTIVDCAELPQPKGK
jgi:outer membrane protein OmpA-like peptidoglycan-associated protein